MEEERLKAENEKLKREVQLLKERLVQAEVDNGGDVRSESECIAQSMNE